MSYVYQYTPTFDKHRKAASSYSNMVTGVNGELDSAIGKLNNISSMLSASKNSSNDLLTFNVASSSKEIISELQTVKSKLSSYSSALSGRAKTYDEQEKNEWIALNKKMMAKKEKT